MAQSDTQAHQAHTAIQVRLAGRIQAVTRKTGAKATAFRTILKTPARDHFSSPGTFEVRSAQSLGSEGQDVTVLCELAGYARSYKGGDGYVATAEHVLTAV